jgi:hypothetical protein
MSKPPEEYLWAETADPGDVADPSLKRPAGWQFQDDLPHQDANYLFRASGRWIDWLQKQFGDVKELTLDALHGSLKVTTDNADLHVMQHDHTGAGYAVLRSDLVRIDGAPADATRRAAAPLDRSLYVPALVKAVVELTWSGTAWTVTHGHNVGATVFESDDLLSFEVALLDFAAITGVVQVNISGLLDFVGTNAPRYYVRGEVDPGGVLRWRPRWFNGSTWQDWRPTGPSDTVTLTMTVF